MVEKKSSILLIDLGYALFYRYSATQLWYKHSHPEEKDILETSIYLGVKVVLVLKRRIINEMMTTYLPTVLILIIVYSTNFFKHFFFEAVVTVNLTALLVLTTLFISVSG